jgi:hypothetical protein
VAESRRRDRETFRYGSDFALSEEAGSRDAHDE